MNMSSYKCCTKDTVVFKNVSLLASLIRLIGEESRLKILCILKQDKHCVCEIIEHLQLSQSLISHHLKDLKDAGIIQNKKKGPRVFYTLTKKGKHIINLLFKL